MTDLVTKANAQHRNIRVKQTEKLVAQSRIFRPGRSRRNADHFQIRATRQLQQCRIVVLDDFELAAKGVKGLNQIVGKRIVIIDEQKHVLHPFPEAQAA